jgi:hypothetical protein
VSWSGRLAADGGGSAGGCRGWRGCLLEDGGDESLLDGGVEVGLAGDQSPDRVLDLFGGTHLDVEDLRGELRRAGALGVVADLV